MMNTFDCAFIMTEVSENLIESGNQKILDKMILAFNRNGLLRLEDLYSLSPDSTDEDTNQKPFQIIVNGYSFDALPYDLFEILYNNAWEYDFVFSHTTSSSNFFVYMKEKIYNNIEFLRILNLPISNPD